VNRRSKKELSCLYFQILATNLLNTGEGAVVVSSVDAGLAMVTVIRPRRTVYLALMTVVPA